LPVSFTLTTNSGLKCEATIEATRGSGWYSCVPTVMPRVADDLQRLQRVALHDHVLRRPVGAGDRQLVLVALVLADVSTERASRPMRISATLSGFSIHRSIMLILASRPITNR
jgi:hypothetical protein